MNYFDNCYTKAEIKDRYHQWAMKLHPDKMNNSHYSAFQRFP